MMGGGFSVQSFLALSSSADIEGCGSVAPTQVAGIGAVRTVGLDGMIQLSIRCSVRGWTSTELRL